jgi:hypothetical protein
LPQEQLFRTLKCFREQVDILKISNNDANKKNFIKIMHLVYFWGNLGRQL